MASTREQAVRIILTGPESTGKSVLSKELSGSFGGQCIEEYAREYVLKLERPYHYEDVVHIAEMQASQMEAFLASGNKLAFFDTYLIITRVWMDVVFEKIPKWIDKEIEKTKSALYLLCKPDLPWVPDPLRENGGMMREKLFRRYEDVLNQFGLQYAFVEGAGTGRIVSASQHINSFMKTNG